MTIRPLQNRVIVETERQTESVTPAGVILIEDHAPAVVGRVIAAPETAEIQPEDVVIFSPESGQPLDLDGSSYLVLGTEEILAIYESEGVRV